jgi:hypothetical protein
VPGAQENGGVREDSAIPARALLPTDQGRPRSNCIGASVHWTGRARGHEPARIPQWHSGQYEALTKSKPRHQPSRPETRPNQRLYVPLGSPPLVAVGSSSARAAHRSRAPHTRSAKNGLDCGASKGFTLATAHMSPLLIAALDCRSRTRKIGCRLGKSAGPSTCSTARRLLLHSKQSLLDFALACGLPHQACAGPQITGVTRIGR